MATPGQFVAKLSEVLKISEATLTVYDRTLRDAGLLSKGGRGRGSIHRSPLDAARFLIALLVTPSPARAVDAVNDFGNLVHEQDHIRDANRLTLDELWPAFRRGHTFEEALSCIIAGFGDQRFRDVLWDRGYELPSTHGKGTERHYPGLQISVRDTKVDASINIDGNEYFYHHAALLKSNKVREGTPLAQIEAMLSAGEPFYDAMDRYAGIRSVRSLAMPEIAPIAEFICGVSSGESA